MRSNGTLAVVVQEFVERASDTVLEAILAAITHLDMRNIGPNDCDSGFFGLQFARDDSWIRYPVIRAKRKDLGLYGQKARQPQIARYVHTLAIGPRRAEYSVFLIALP